MSLNAVASFVLFHNTFPTEEETLAFLQAEVLSNLPHLASPCDDLIAKV